MNKRNMFYYDESFHTRVISKGYIEDESSCDYYIGAAVGWNASNDSRIIELYNEFEKKYMEFYSVEELKSEIFRKKFYRYGLASFRKEQVKFYNDYFSIIEQGGYTYISAASKMESVIGQVIVPFYGCNSREAESYIHFNKINITL